MRPEVAVVIPVFRQGRWLPGALLSVLLQRPRGLAVAVVVDDGCPQRLTRLVTGVARILVPRRVRVLRQPNRGVSAARNAGIRHALATWPSVRAVFPLDADNQLRPHALRRCLAALDAHPDRAWVVPDQEFFGASRWVLRRDPCFSLYAQLHENQADTGVLIGREVLEAGVLYDDTRERNGYEDWAWALDAAAQGFLPVHAGDVGFRYRDRPHSMLTRSQRRHLELHEAVVRPHRRLLEPRRVTALEHRDLPRAALVALDEGWVARLAGWVAAGAAAPREPLAAFLGDVAATGGGITLGPPTVPAVALAGDAAALAALDAARLLPGLLLHAQVALRERPAVHVVLGRHADPRGLSVIEPTGGGREEPAPAVLALDGLTLAAVLGGAPLPSAPVRIAVALGEDLAPGLPSGDAAAGLLAAFAAARPLPALRRERLPTPGTPRHTRSLSAWSRFKHVEELTTTFPWRATTGADVALVAPELPDPAALPAVRGDERLHLVLTDGGEARLAPAQLAGLATVTTVAGVPEPLRHYVLSLVLRSMDRVELAGSELGRAVCHDLAPRSCAPG